MKARFLTSLQLEDIDGTRMVLLAPLRFYSLELKQIVQALPGFVTDFASIPRGLWNFFPKNGIYDYAAVLHDAAYRLVLADARGNSLRLTKSQADRLFREAMEVRGVGTVRRTLMYAAVKFFGRGEFGDNK